MADCNGRYSALTMGKEGAKMSKNSKEWYCKSCGHKGTMKEVRPGSGLITFFLFWFLILPAILYSQWRWSSRKRTCPACRGTDVIPADSSLVPVQSGLHVTS